MDNPKNQNDKKENNNYLRYSGLGLQIVGSAVLGVFIGYELDKLLKTHQPYFLLGCTLLFLAGGMYLALRDLVKGK